MKQSQREHPTQPPSPADLAWLAEARKRGPLLTEQQPVWVVSREVHSPGQVPMGGHLHAYCEITLSQKGFQGVQMVGGESIERRGGTVLLLGPGLPHKTLHKHFPARSLTVYFLPSVLLNLGPENECLRLLHRLTVRQPVHDRLLKPSAAVWSRLEALVFEMLDEFERPRLGSGMRLRVMLVELLLDLLRWETAAGGKPVPPARAADWEPLARVLRHLHEHFAEPIYSRDLARLAGMSRSRMHEMFHHGLGIPWVRYLQGYRIHRAAALLAQPGFDVTRAAFEVGFASLSHFNVTFRRFIGVNPSQYLRRSQGVSRPT